MQNNKKENNEENNKEDLAVISKKELGELKEKAKLSDSNYDQLLRLKAEFENFKKRTDKEKADFLNFANQSLIYELLDIIDNFERAVDAADKTNDHKLLHQGVEMILKNLHSLLKEKGLSKIESVGQIFDPAKHEAISQVESKDQPDNIIVEELQTGYMINGRVIRPAKVKVSVKPKEEEEKK